MSAEATLWISENYISGLQKYRYMDSIDNSNHMTGSDWTFFSSGNIDLANYIWKIKCSV